MSERIRASENLPSCVAGECGSDVYADLEAPSENRVRELTAPAPPAPGPSTLPSPPAHTSNCLIAQLNTNWRVVDDPLQWMLQRRKGNPRKKNSGWQDRCFCRTRDGLLRCVRELCGEIDDQVATRLRALPEFHTDWEPSR